MGMQALCQARAVELIEALQDTCQNYREESFIDELWREVLHTAQKSNTSFERVKKKKATEDQL